MKKKFNVGDRVKWGDHTGTIKEVGADGIETVTQWDSGLGRCRDMTLSLQFKKIKEAKMSKYDLDTVRAIEESIEHHEDNLMRLKRGKGEFFNDKSQWELCIGTVIMSYGGSACVLCQIFSGRCQDCPLTVEGYKCGNEDSPWQKITEAKTREEAITAEENMVKVLKLLLEEEEEEIGYRVKDRVKIVASGYNDDYKGQIGTIIVDDSTITPYLIRLDNGGETWQKPDGIKLIKGEEMNIKRKIENINEDTTIKELDDLLQEITACEMGHWAYTIQTVEDCLTIYWGIKTTENSLENFRYNRSDQCSKLQALKDALLWLAKKSGKLKDNKKEIEQIDEEIDSLREKKKRLEVEDE